MQQLASFKKVLSHVTLPSLLLQIDGSKFILEFANEAYLQLLHANANNILHKPLISTPNFGLNGNNGQVATLLLQQIQNTVNNKQENTLKNQPFTIHNLTANCSNKHYFTFNITPIATNDANVNAILLSITNVTEKVEAEQKIQVLQAQLNKITHEVAEIEKQYLIGRFEIDVENKKIWWSDEIFIICGYEPQAFDPSETQHFNITHPDDIAIAQKTLEETIQFGTPFSVERRLIKANGETVYILSKGTPIKNEVGSVIKISGIFQDITQQVVQNQAITAIKNNQEALINGTSDLIWLMDKHMQVLIANNAYTDKINELTQGYAINNSDAIIQAKVERQVRWSGLIPQVLKGNSVSFKESILNPISNQLEYAAVTINPIRNAIGEVINIACIAKDITTDTNNLITLQTTKTKLENILAASPDIICTLDGNGDFLDVSASSEKILGYKPEEMSGKSIAVFLHPDDLAKTMAEAPKVRETGVLIHFENRYLKKNGDIINISWTGSYQAEKDILHCVGRDVTDKKKQEEALQASKKEYENLFENNPLPMFIWDFETLKIIKANQESLELYGYTKDEFLQLTIKDIRPVQDISLIEAATKSVDIYGEVHKKNWRHQKKDGTIFYVDLTAHLINHQGRKASLVLLNDVTEKLLAQNTLIISEAKYRSFFENSLDAIIITTGLGQILDVNPAACTLFWRDKAEFNTLKRHDLFDSTDPRLATFIAERDLNGKAKAEVTFITKIGKKYQCEISSSIFKNKEGNLNNLIIVRDINKRKKAENLLQESEAKYRSFFENSLDGIFITKSNGDILEANTTAQNMFNMSLEEIRIAGRNGTVDQTDERLAQLLQERNMFGKTRAQIRHVRKNGSKFEAEVTTSTFTNAQGETINALITRDITDRVLNEQKLKESNERFKYVTQATSDAIWDWDLLTDTVYWGEGFQTVFGYNLTDIEPNNNFRVQRTHPKDRDRVMNGMYGVINSNNTNWEDNYRFLKADNTYAQVTNRGFVIRDTTGKAIRMVGAKRDISLSQYYSDLEKLERNILAINEAGDKTIEEILSIYLLGIEVLHPSMTCSILQLQGNQLFNLASPSLPEAYIQAINGVEIGNNTGSCGTAAYTKKKVIVTDIETDIRWANYKYLAAEFGLKACWSYPIFNNKNNVIATFATYYQTKKQPSILEENTINRGSNILKIIIESYARTQALKESNERYNYATKATSDAIWDWDLVTGNIIWGEGWQSIFGFDINTISNKSNFMLAQTHPDDIARITNIYNQIIKSNEANWEAQYRFKKANNQYAYVISRGFVIRDKFNKAVRIVAATRDITTRKEEELRLKLLESVITNTNDSVLITEAEPFNEPGPSIIYVNEAFTKMTGYAAAEVIGKTPRILQGAKTDRNELDKINQALKNWDSCEVTLINYKKDGSEFWVNFLISPVADENGWFTHWVSIQRDVTEKVLEEQNLTKAIIKAQENERYEIGGELHDNVCQILTSSQLSLKMLKKALAPKELVWYETGVDAIILASREIRNLSHRLAPSFFNDTTLELAITSLINTFNVDEQYKIRIEFDDVFKKTPTKQDFQINLYRIVQEQLKNIFKYAEATIIEVVGTVKGGKLQMEIIDNGLGFDTTKMVRGIGIANMKRRTELFLGKFYIQSEPKKGCKVIIEVPIEEVN